MTMSQFTVRGQFKDRDGWRGFEKGIEAENESLATEYVYALYGSNHGLRRAQITVEEVESE